LSPSVSSFSAPWINLAAWNISQLTIFIPLTVLLRFKRAAARNRHLDIHNGYRHRVVASSGFGDSDIDVFFYGLGPSEATAKLEALGAHLNAVSTEPKSGVLDSEPGSG
jgi:hypothetical protein